MQQNSQQIQAPIPDSIISVPTAAGSQQKGAIVGNIVFAQNRGNTKTGQAYKAHQLSINVEALKKAINDGSIKVSKSGVVYFNFVTLDDNAKAKIAANREKNRQAKSTGGASGGQDNWGSQKSGKAF